VDDKKDGTEGIVVHYSNSWVPCHLLEGAKEKRKPNNLRPRIELGTFRTQIQRLAPEKGIRLLLCWNVLMKLQFLFLRRDILHDTVTTNNGTFLGSLEYCISYVLLEFRG